MTVYMKKGNKIVKTLKKDAIAAALAAGTIAGGMVLVVPVSAINMETADTVVEEDWKSNPWAFCDRWFNGQLSTATENEFLEEFRNLATYRVKDNVYGFALHNFPTIPGMTQILLSRMGNSISDTRENSAGVTGMDGFVITSR